MTWKNISIKPIPNYPGYFAVSTGVILSFRHCNGHRKSPLVMEQFIKKDGYLQTQLRHPKWGSRSENTHRLIAVTFIPNPKNKPTVNHKNGKKRDNRVVNLEWATRKEQSQHALKTLGINPAQWTKGNKFSAFLSLSQVRAIRKSLADGGTGVAVARRFRVSTATVSLIKNRKTWA